MSSLYCRLQQQGVLVWTGVQRGGYTELTGDVVVVGPETSCDPCPSLFTSEFITPVFITLCWDPIANNGTMTVTIVEFYNEVWNLRFGVGQVLVNNATWNEQSGSTGILQYNPVCRTAILDRNRNGSSSYQIGSHQLQPTTLTIRNRIIGCSSVGR